MNRKEWKRNYKKFSKNKLKRKRTQLKDGAALTRSPVKILPRSETK